jgi:hypothetical protein
MKNFYQIFFALMSMTIVAFFAFSMHQELYDRGYEAGVKAATSQLNERERQVHYFKHKKS